MNYKETLRYLDSLRPQGFRMELGPLSEICHSLDDPQDGFPSVHIGGTNGKGSTSAFLTDVMAVNDYRVGLYTSPHLVDVRERIQVNRNLISKDDFACVMSRIRGSLPNESMLSYFEIICLASFIYFKEQKVDIAIYEVGLGGRLDATNVLTPKVSIITPISFDHMQHLGVTLQEIAREKCGIIKRGVPTVVAYQVPEVMDAIRHACDDVGSPLCLATPDEVDFPLGLPGEHQRQNAACAMEAAHLLASSGFKIENISGAMAGTKWPCRLETVCSNPHVILDAAHNVAGAESLASYVRSNIPKEKAVLLLGVLADKDVAGIVRSLAPQFREIICVKAPSERAASPKDIAAAARSSGIRIKIEKGAAAATIRNLLKTIGKEDTLVISGSLTVVGEAKGYFDKVSR